MNSLVLRFFPLRCCSNFTMMRCVSNSFTRPAWLNVLLFFFLCFTSKICYVPPAKYARIRCRRYLREKYQIKGYSWRIHTNSLMRDHHLQSTAISSKRIMLKSRKMIESFHEYLWSMSGELQDVNVITKSELGSSMDAMRDTSYFAWFIWQILSDIGRSRSLRMVQEVQYVRFENCDAVGDINT